MMRWRGVCRERPVSQRRCAVMGLALCVTLLSAAVLLSTGCGSDRESQPVRAVTETTVAVTTTMAGASSPSSDSAKEGGYAESGEDTLYGETPGRLAVTVAQTAFDRKIISNANLQIEVEKGRFQTAFDQATLLADKYGGYIVSSNASVVSDEDEMRSGTIAVRIPAASMAAALSDAAKLGTVKARGLESQDVTEEYVDLKARLANAEAQERALLDLMGRAKTIDEILQVRQVLTNTQQEIEQFKGRMKFLEEHSSFATIVLTIYEPGTITSPEDEGWGFVEALREALRGLVSTINELVVFLGEALPVLVILAVIAYVVYRIVRAVVRRRDARATAEREYWAQAATAQGGQARPLGQAAAQAGQAPPVAQDPSGRGAAASHGAGAPHTPAAPEAPSAGDEPEQGR